MKRDRRTRSAVLLLLALLAGLSGGLSAACAPLCPMRSAMSCCQPSSAASTIKAFSCCEILKALAPLQSERAVAPSASAPIALAAPLRLSLEPRVARPLPAPTTAPPLLHEGVGLYTLLSVFLI